jgi:hypothetical protein
LFLSLCAVDCCDVLVIFVHEFCSGCLRALGTDVRSLSTTHFINSTFLTLSFITYVEAAGFVSAQSEQPDCMNPNQALGDNLELFDQQQQELVATLLTIKQEHLFQDWPARGTDDDKKINFIKQLQTVDTTYVGGIKSYVTKAKKLLASAAEGENPFDGFTPSVPSGEDLLFGDEEYQMMENLGIEAARKLAFVLVAGGLGERLGFSGIKVCTAVLPLCYLYSCANSLLLSSFFFFIYYLNI